MANKIYFKMYPYGANSHSSEKNPYFLATLMIESRASEEKNKKQKILSVSPNDRKKVLRVNNIK